MKKYGWLLLGVLACALLLLPGVIWDGDVPAEVQVRVIDAVSGAPIQGAGVEVLNYNGEPHRLPVPTDMAGVGTISIIVGAGGMRTLLYQKLEYGTDRELIRVNAPGYVEKRAAPGHGQGMQVLGFGPKPQLSVTVPLARAPTKE